MDRNIEPSYEMASKILASMTVSKPMSLSELSAKTNFSFGLILQCCTILVPEGILYRAQDGGKIFYILLKKDYQETLKNLFPSTEATKPLSNAGKVVFSKDGDPQRETSSLDSKPAMSKAVKPGTVETKTSASKSNHKKTEKQVQLKPARDSSLLSLPRSEATARVRTRSSVEERQSSQNVKERRTRRSDSSPRVDSISKTSELQSVSSQFSASLPNRNFPISGSFKRVTSLSSSSHKAIFINNPTRPGSGATPSRSMYNAAPPIGFDPNALRRSDTNLPPKASIEARPKTPPLLAFRPNVQSQNELTEEALREKLGISNEALLVTLVVNRGCHELWTTFSAVANAGGGYIMLGIRKHGGSYFIKSITRAVELVKSLLEDFANRELISDCPDDTSYIRTVEFGRKHSVVIEVEREKLSNRPVYTAMDSFGTQTNNGCYIYRDGEVMRCTEEETKELWESYLGTHRPDWDQESELPNLELKRKVKPVLPPIIDDAVRPLSRKVSTYGQAIVQPHRKGKKRHWDKPVLAALASQDAASSPKPASPRVPSPISAGPQSGRFSAQNSLFQSSEPTAMHELVEEILLAEDIRVVKKAPSDARGSMNERRPSTIAQKANTEAKVITETAASKEKPSQTNHRDELLVIAEPATKHARMPLIRLAEIVEGLTRHTALDLNEISDLIGRRPAYIKDRVIAKLQENDDFIVIDGKYTWKD